MYHICDNYAYTYTHIHARDPICTLKASFLPMSNMLLLNSVPERLPCVTAPHPHTKSIMGIGPLTQAGFQGNKGLGLGSPPTQGHRAKGMESPQ